MSNRSMWKMLHLLYTVPPRQQPGLTYHELYQVGIDCGPDTINPLIEGGAAYRDADRIVLSNTAETILGACVIANRRWSGRDIWVDYPKAFVIMPFSLDWSDDVYQNMIEPAVRGAGLECIRGDKNPRIGDLTQNIWNEILQAGVIIADVSAPNPNVFYELGLAHALGKDVFILMQQFTVPPADFGGSHYYLYDRNNLRAGKDMLQQTLDDFAKDNKFQEVKSLRGGS